MSDLDPAQSKEFRQMDKELEEMRLSLKDKLDARSDALNAKVDALLQKAPATSVSIPTAEVDGASDEAASRGQGKRRSSSDVPQWQNVAVCGLGEPEGRLEDGSLGTGQQVYAMLKDAADMPYHGPAWVDLLAAAQMPFEKLDALLLRSRTLVICPDVGDDERRTILAVRDGLKAVLSSLPDPLSRVLFLSQVGAQSMKGGINMRSFFGLGYEGTFAGLEDELTSAARRRTGNRPMYVTMVRVGAPRATSSSSTVVRCLEADAGGARVTSHETAAQALLQCLALAVNTNVCIVEEPVAAAAPPNWGELLLPFRGPELWRTDVDDVRRAAVFVQTWAEEWFGESREGGLLRWGLKTPVQIRKTSVGVVFKFRPLDTLSGRTFEDLDAGGIEFMAEQPAQGPPRLRARRCAYGFKVVAKENSERALMQKFVEDWRMAR